MSAPEYGSLTSFLAALDDAIRQRQGLQLEALLSLTDRRKNPALHRLTGAKIVTHEREDEVFRDIGQIAASTQPAWRDTAVHFWRAAGCLRDRSAAADAFTHAAAMAGAIIKGFVQWEAWVLPVLFSACRDVHNLAIKADAVAEEQGQPAEYLEEAARIINRAFTLCITDRAPLEASRKWGTYCVIGILFRTYFKLDKLSLTKNVLRAVEVSELPPLQYFPKAHIVTWRYYLGVIAFMGEDYMTAETELREALRLCHRAAARNVELILTYLVPTVLMTTRRLPSVELLRSFPRVAALYHPLTTALRSGNLAAYDRALARRETELVRRRVYLTFERARDLCLRSLFRKVYLLKDKSTRIPVADLTAAANLGTPPEAQDMCDDDEAECYVANLIHAGFVKGYISREKRTVVLSAKDPFPKVVRELESW